MMQTLFSDRRDAGRQLAVRLGACAGVPGVRVVALPRGGLPVGYEVARLLGAPLDVLVVRKLGAPCNEEFAMGAIAPGVCHVSEHTVEALGLAPGELQRLVEREGRELARREQLYRARRAPLDVGGACVLLVDDGMATGMTMRVALRALRAQAPARLVAAVPVGSPSACEDLRAEADEVVCLATPQPFGAVGRFYADFRQTSDEEVCELLARAALQAPEEAGNGLPRRACARATGQ